VNQVPRSGVNMNRYTYLLDLRINLLITEKCFLRDNITHSIFLGLHEKKL
jgi:hypothetical protein